ncbi:hypothetical protein ACERII_24660 [Evansella sp. AB-rgal1]|uniref:hypothetical protein n=1 Tax=Evansella sp. AB-rgal1 TaxID=3242696 RepID=UPI00359D5AB4
MTRKIMLLIVLLIAIIGVMLYFLDESQKTNNSYHRLNELVLYVEFKQYINNLYYISDTMELFDEDFTEREKELYRQSLNNTHLNLNSLSLSLSLYYLSDNIYEEGYRYLGDTMRTVNTQLQKVKNIDDKQKNQAIINVLEQYYAELVSFSYEEVTTEQGIDEITNILNQLREDVEMVLNES